MLCIYKNGIGYPILSYKVDTYTKVALPESSAVCNASRCEPRSATGAYEIADIILTHYSEKINPQIAIL